MNVRFRDDQLAAQWWNFFGGVRATVIVEDNQKMDPFQIRLECLQLVRRLTASQQSIMKVVDFAVRYAAVAAEDIWDCLLTECGKVSSLACYDL